MTNDIEKDFEELEKEIEKTKGWLARYPILKNKFQVLKEKVNLKIHNLKILLERHDKTIGKLGGKIQ